MIKTKGDSKKKNENDLIDIGIIEDWVNENTKDDQLALFLSITFISYIWGYKLDSYLVRMWRYMHTMGEERNMFVGLEWENKD